MSKLGVHDAISLSSLYLSEFQLRTLYLYLYTLLQYLANQYHQSVGIKSTDYRLTLGAITSKDHEQPFIPKSKPSASSAMTTNLNAIAGPSKLPPSPLVEIESPTQSLDSPGREAHRGLTQEPTVSRPGLSVDENGEIIKVPAFLNKLFRLVLYIYWDEGS